ncbi:hypothetical protein [Streptomyces sp. Isolate_45]|uniref:hypothetical protein n=1 Tax=Streptomyces sp. Isolate_45 TaxID=2950111 RepID=UPI002481CB95|nr:hypothetical protein [Streptomyces sp. Isolate_45]MDA5284186.1 hypothetical protein [Streptomyces sp. Isolate_45]
MTELTYDPVLDLQPVPRWRLINPLRPPAPGRALVLVPDSGAALTILPGEEIPAARFGSYQSVYTVDLAEHRLILDIPLLSRDATFSFRSRVDLVCRVANPAEVVRRGIRDMSGALYGHLRTMLRAVAREYDVAEFHQAERALNASVSGFTGDSAVLLRGLHVELLIDEDEIATSGREFRDVVRETRLDGMRRRRHLELMRDEGVEGIIAEIMEREGPRAALAWVEKGQAEQREARLQTLRMVLERGDADREPFEQAELERAVIDGILGGEDEPFGGPRRGRLRGALSSGRDPLLSAPGPTGDAGRPSPDPGPSGRTSPAAKPWTSGRTPLRGEVVTPGSTVPPEDEPVPPTTPPGRPEAGGGGRAPGDRPASGTVGMAKPSRLPGPARHSGSERPYDAATPASEQPRRVSRVRGTAKRQRGADGGERA